MFFSFHPIVSLLVGKITNRIGYEEEDKATRQRRRKKVSPVLHSSWSFSSYRIFAYEEESMRKKSFLLRREDRTIRQKETKIPLPSLHHTYLLFSVVTIFYPPCTTVYIFSNLFLSHNSISFPWSFLPGWGRTIGASGNSNISPTVLLTESAGLTANET